MFAKVDLRDETFTKQGRHLSLKFSIIMAIANSNWPHGLLSKISSEFAQQSKSVNSNNYYEMLFTTFSQ